jgi:hypothetical protein
MYAVSNFSRDQACKTRPRHCLKSHVLVLHSLAARLTSTIYVRCIFWPNERRRREHWTQKLHDLTLRRRKTIHDNFVLAGNWSLHFLQLAMPSSRPPKHTACCSPPPGLLPTLIKADLLRQLPLDSEDDDGSLSNYSFVQQSAVSLVLLGTTPTSGGMTMRGGSLHAHASVCGESPVSTPRAGVGVRSLGGGESSGLCMLYI